MKRFLIGLALTMGFLAAGSAWAGTLDDVAKNGVLRGGFRENAHPFAYKGPNGQPAGFGENAEGCKKPFTFYQTQVV